MNRQVLKEIIVTNKNFILNEVKKIIPRNLGALPKSINKTIIFYGVRRSGKTFLLFDILKKNNEVAFYLDFEDERLTEFQTNDFDLLKEAVLELNPGVIGKRLIFLFDEVQNIPGWEKFCRRAIERENIKIFISGSSSKVMPSEMHTAMRGRTWSIEVLPFSFNEYLCARGIDVMDRSLLYSAERARIKYMFSQFMKWGGFPEVSFVKQNIERTKLLKEYYSAMFFRDLVERYKITNITLLEALSDKLFSSFSTKFSLSSFYKQYKNKFPFSKDLLFAYYHYFIQNMLIFEVRLFAESTYKRMRNPSKIYCVDVGLCRKVSSTDYGRILENIVFIELRRRGNEVFYFTQKNECDFIATSDKKEFIPIQVCAELNEGNREREINGLVEACKWFGTRGGLLLTYDEEMILKEKGIKIDILPVWKWVAFPEFL